MEKLEKSQKQAYLALTFMCVSFIIPIITLIAAGLFDTDVYIVLVKIAFLIAIPLYFAGLILVIVARVNCKECLAAKVILIVYIVLTAVLIVLGIVLVVVFWAVVISCVKAFAECKDCLDYIKSCPG